jgi:hypothetical protein
MTSAHIHLANGQILEQDGAYIPLPMPVVQAQKLDYIGQAPMILKL